MHDGSVPYDSVVSVSSMRQQVEMRQRVKESKNRRNRLAWINSFLSGASLTSLATGTTHSPCLLARVMMEECLGMTAREIKETIKQPESTVARIQTIKRELKSASDSGTLHSTAQCVAQPAAQPVDDGTANSSLPIPSSSAQALARSSSAMLPTSTTSPHHSAASVTTTMSNASSSRSSPFLRDGLNIPTERWVQELYACIHADQYNSPYHDNIKHLTGRSYEHLLESYLSHLNIPFQSESHSRTSGAARTPDTLLLTPILVHGHVVCWIDSKAQFGDELAKRTHLETQLRAYVNRYGKGMVIYWMDFVEDEPNGCSQPIHAPQHDEKAENGQTCDHKYKPAPPATYDNGNILVVSDFPSDIVTMQQLLHNEVSMTGRMGESAALPLQ